MQMFNKFSFLILFLSFLPWEKVFLPYLQKLGVIMTRYQFLKAVQVILSNVQLIYFNFWSSFK